MDTHGTGSAVEQTPPPPVSPQKPLTSPQSPSAGIFETWKSIHVLRAAAFDGSPPLDNYPDKTLQACLIYANRHHVDHGELQKRDSTKTAVEKGGNDDGRRGEERSCSLCL